ncbi:HYDIN protein, partial [Malurus elegans]|nr:HYDIN protein [Malurus elegans]
VSSLGVEATLVVKNPCNFPVEFYSLDYDEQYLHEEKILRMVRRSDSPKIFWLPPRAPGETLPLELLEYPEARKRLKAQQEEAKARVEAEAQAKAKAEAEAEAKTKAEPVIEVIEDPVDRALRRHLGIDTSVEEDEALQPRGIVVIVHGAPRSGKTKTAVALANYYGAVCLSIDAVVKAAMANE